MRKRTARLLILTALAAAALVRVPLAAPAPAERFLDTAPEAYDGVRLTVFYPSAGSVRALANLFQKGLLDPAGVTVVGVYHEKEATDYAASARYAADGGLSWMKFHAVSAPIGPDDLYRKNGCTPEFEAIVEKTDGVIFFGGPDIPPAVYGKKTSLLSEIEDPYRHYFELSAVFHFIGGPQDDSRKPLLEARMKFPILGICLGFQTLNVGAGGTMVQDIWDEVYGEDAVEDIIKLGPSRWHNNPWPRLRPDLKLIRYNLHALKLGADGAFVREWGFSAAATPVIVSSHHQALDRVGRNFKVIASSLDGRVPEAIIHLVFPNVLGIQFHPEFPLLWDPDFRGRFTPDDQTATSLLVVLEQKSPSLEFNKRIWSWLGTKLRESRAAK
jgi:putative glutamine amidotransferase